MTFDITREIKADKTFRVASIMGQFDLQSEKACERFIGEIDLSQSWNVGVIYGASGTGKSTIAKELFPNEYVKNFDYTNKAIIDEMPKEKTVFDITAMFNSVGFATVWSWLKPYDVLSTGEKMRVDLARAILENKNLIVFDEFTSVVNREVAKHGSFALQKSIRKQNKKFIAVSCHKDILEWLEPDWTFCTDSMTFTNTRGLLRRPKIEIKIYERKGMWDVFRKYHYLNTSLNDASHQYIAYIQNEPVAFFAIQHFPHPKIKNMKRGHRLVVLPDYQGLGIGHLLSSKIAEMWVKKGFRFTITSSTKSLLKQRLRDKNWVVKRQGRCGSGSGVMQNSNKKGSTSSAKITYSYEYICN